VATCVIRGGAGNQLFQLYACYLISQQTNSRVSLDIDTYSHPSQISLGRQFEFVSLAEALGFRIKKSTRTTLFRRLKIGLQLIVRHVAQRFPAMFRLIGVFASEKADTPHAFLGCLEKIRYLDGYFLNLPEFPTSEMHFELFLKHLKGELEKQLPDVAHHERESMSLHLRLGDFKSDSPDFMPRITALQSVLDSSGGGVVNLFSDEPELAITLLGELRNVHFNAIDVSLGTKPTLALMAHSGSLICSRSTFSWWAASVLSSIGGQVWWPSASREEVGLKPRENWLLF
jgi:hypothetical protein